MAGTSREMRFDHFGYRPGDRKVALFTRDPQGKVEVRDCQEELVWRIPEDGGAIRYGGLDKASEDRVWQVDFSGLARPGTHYLYAPALSQRSYPFEVRADIYNVPVLAAIKAWYFQRCNIAKVAPYAHHWQDDKPCHVQDRVAICTSYVDGERSQGLLDLTGGWHDAGDYSKSASHPWWLLATYELNPSVFAPGQLNLPESGNGVPDILNEARWGLDLVLKSCLPEGSIVGGVIGYPAVNFASPPSVDTTHVRAYFPPGVSSTAAGVSSLARGARVFRGIDDEYADTLAEAALKSWRWLEQQPTRGDDEVSWGDLHYGIHAVPNPPRLESAHVCRAAAEVFALDQSATSARDCVDRCRPDNWARARIYPHSLAPHLFIIHTYCQTRGATPGTVANMKQSLERMVEDIFARKTGYGFSLDERDWTWGSNSNICCYGLRSPATGPSSWPASPAQ